jgi:hypothetical protein
MAVMDKLEVSTCFLLRTTDKETRIRMTCIDTNKKYKMFGPHNGWFFRKSNGGYGQARFFNVFLVHTKDTEMRIGMTCTDTNDRIKCLDHITADFFTHQIVVMKNLDF